jgi:hypothetical protein
MSWGFSMDTRKINLSTRILKERGNLREARLVIRSLIKKSPYTSRHSNPWSPYFHSNFCALDSATLSI